MVEEALYGIVVEDRSDLVFVVSEHGACVHANARARLVLGVSSGEGNVLAATHPNDRDSAELNFGRVTRGETLTFRYRVREGSSWRWLEIAASPTRYQGAPHAIATARDVTEQKRADDLQAVQLAVSRVLAEASDTIPATIPLLDAVCTGIACDVGELWVFDSDCNELRCAGQWHSHHVNAQELAQVTRSRSFVAGVGLPGSVWQSRQPLWIADIAQEPGAFVRVDEAVRAGLRSAVGCPIVHRDQLLAVLVILSREASDTSAETLDLLAAVSNQIAQFMARQRVEATLRDMATRFRAVVDFAPVMLVTLDRDATITFAQGRGLELAGLPPRSPVGENARAAFGDQPGVLSSIDRALAGEAFTAVAETNGHTFETVWTPILAADGSVEGASVVAVDITDRARAEAAVEANYRASLREKEMLLKELHHRVKNNLQLVSSLLELQSEQLDSMPGIQGAFVEAQLRIRTMASIHDILCRSGDMADVDLGPHIQSVCGQIYQSFAVDVGRVALDLDVADVSMSVDVALPYGLIINELVANSLKHAFPGDRRGTIGVHISTTPGSIALLVRDDGIGIATDIDPLQTETLGLQLVRDLAHQLGATIAVERSGGTAFALSMPWTPQARQ